MGAAPAPALAHAGLVLIAGGIAADAGAGTFGILLAALAAAVAPAYLGSASILTMDVYRSLPAADRARACILASNYGEAGAVDFFGPVYGLRGAISGHNRYYLWGPRGCDFSVVVSIGLPGDELARLFTSVQPAATVDCQYCVPDENGISVDVDRGPRQSPAATWRLLRERLADGTRSRLR